MVFTIELNSRRTLDILRVVKISKNNKIEWDKVCDTKGHTGIIELLDNQNNFIIGIHSASLGDYESPEKSYSFLLIFDKKNGDYRKFDNKEGHYISKIGLLSETELIIHYRFMPTRYHASDGFLALNIENLEVLRDTMFNINESEYSLQAFNAPDNKLFFIKKKLGTDTDSSTKFELFTLSKNLNIENLKSFELPQYKRVIRLLFLPNDTFIWTHQAKYVFTKQNRVERYILEQVWRLDFEKNRINMYNDSIPTGIHLEDNYHISIPIIIERTPKYSMSGIDLKTSKIEFLFNSNLNPADVIIHSPVIKNNTLKVFVENKETQKLFYLEKIIDK